MHLIAAGKEVYNGGLIEEPELNKRLRKIESCIRDPAGMKILKVNSQRALSSPVRVIPSGEQFRPTSGRQIFRDRSVFSVQSASEPAVNVFGILFASV